MNVSDDVPSLVAAQTGLGTAALIVMNKQTDVVKAIARLAMFYKHESSGQCTPCREGIDRKNTMTPRLQRLTGCGNYPSRLKATLSMPLLMGAAWPVQGLNRHFRPELEYR